MNINKRMKAYVRTNAANQKVQLTEVAVPDIQPDEVLVEVKAFGVGIHDRYFIPSNVQFPYPIGSEGSGVIIKLGSRVADFSEGDRVVFMTVLQPQGGSWAELVAVKQSALIPLPENISFANGAAVPVAGNTALECLRSLRLESGKQLFIAGASGAIGTFVIQLAVTQGVKVAGSASENNHEYLKVLGAEKTVDYHDPDWQSRIIEWSGSGVDAALAIQPGTGSESIKTVKDNGRLITVSGYSDQVPPERNIVIEQIGHHKDTQEQLHKLIRAIANGEIAIKIEKEYAFDEALEALEKTETRHARGKSVVRVAEA